MSYLTRRELLKHSSVGAAAASVAWFSRTSALGADTAAKKTTTVTSSAPALGPLNRFGRMLHEYYVNRVREIERAANARRAAVRTKADAAAYVRDVRERIRQSFGAPPEKTPLNARVTGVVERATYTIEKVIFDSRPAYPVTANLYLPKGRRFPVPGVIGTCGHSDTGKAADAYQSFAQGLVRMGYVVLIFDPPGQGERLQLVSAELKPRKGTGVKEHLHVGNQQFLVGEFFGAWRVWDGIRALDYLLTRPEVDPDRIGVTGNSGGGTDAAWLCGLESRWTMAAPSCFVTTFRRNLENELPADTEQCPPRALALGLDHSDFIAALAPKPVVLLDQEKDYFDVRGLEEAHTRLKHLYGLLGAEEQVGMFLGPDYHGFSQPVREAMYRWFNRVTRHSDAEVEPPLTIEKEETLRCTRSGQVAAEGRPRNIPSFTREASVAARMKRGAVSGAALEAALRTILKMPAHDGSPPDYRILRPSAGRNYPKRHAGTYAVETEPGIHALVYRLADEPLLSRPPRGVARAVLYVAHQSADAELRDEPLCREIMSEAKDAAFFACDVRGIGESRPTTTGTALTDPYGADYFYAAHALMLDYPVMGQRTHDVLRVVEWLRACGHPDVHLVGKGWGALPAAFAGLLSGEVAQVTLKHALTSYSDIAEAEDYNWPLAALLPDVIRHFDLPDCYRALAAKNLRQIEPWGAMAGV